MADTKISALSASTTPLAGTEVLPIVQSGATKQVSVANLTAGRAISATQLTLTTENLVVGTAGKGIDFSANTHAAGMTSELLNAYEEGTWTPATTAAGATYVVQTGQYVKVGKVITCTANIQWSAHTNAGANLQISGLPYASSSSATYPSGTISGNLIIATDHSIQTYIIPSTSTITFLDCTDTTGGSASYAIPASANISINYTYITG